MRSITKIVESTETLRSVEHNIKNSIWEGSKFEALRNLSSRSKGANCEKIVSEVMRELNHLVEKRERQGDRMIDGHETEIKSSTCWNDKPDCFTWQQIRKQDYDRIIFFGINPGEVKIWWATKSDLEKHIFDKDQYRQHAGAKGGQELYWLQSSCGESWFRDIETF